MSSESEDAATSSEADGAGDTPTGDSSRNGNNPNAEDLAQHVRGPSPYLPEERETLLSWSRDEGRAHVQSFELGVTRRLLRHPEMEVEYLHVVHDDKSGRVELSEYEDGRIIGVQGRIPVEVVSLRMNPRKGSGHAKVVTNGVLRNGGDDD